MSDHDTNLERIELAEREVAHCPLCGEPTVLQADPDGSIWLECSTLQHPMGTVRRLLTVAAPHFRQEVIAPTVS